MTRHGKHHSALQAPLYMGPFNEVPFNRRRKLNRLRTTRGLPGISRDFTEIVEFRRDL